jgi:myo-inositol-1(or 4)-monophosphatase
MLGQTFDVQWKKRDDPVTAIDHAVNDYLYTALSALAPQFGWLSEETAEDPSWLSREAAWVVDPIDGTKNMLSREREFAVSVALVRQGVPVLAVVYSPVYRGSLDDLISGGVYGLGLRHNRRPLPHPARDLRHPRSIHSHSSKIADNIRNQGFTPVPFGSVAYRLANCAIGRGDVTIGTRSASNPWDIAAGHLLAELGGCLFTDANGHPVRYDRVGMKVDGFVCAASPALHQKMIDLIPRIRAG